MMIRLQQRDQKNRACFEYHAIQDRGSAVRKSLLSLTIFEDLAVGSEQKTREAGEEQKIVCCIM
jgi:hypothetical protein